MVIDKKHRFVIFPKDSIAEGIPMIDTYIGSSNKIRFNGEMKRPIECVDKEKGIKK